MPVLSYGLNVTKKPPLGQRPPPAKRKTIFDDDSGPEDGPDEEETSESISTIGGLQTSRRPESSTKSKPSNTTPSNSTSKAFKAPNISQFGDLSSRHTTKQHSKQAQEIDPSIYDYDAAYDSIHATYNTLNDAETTKADLEKKPKYMSDLLAAAEVRKRDQLRAQEKMLAKEREAEGDEFADKEKFVTGAYKRQQEEMRQLEEEEKSREQETEARKKREGGGMKAFYKDLLGRDDERHAQVMKAVEEGKGKQIGLEDETKKQAKSETDAARERGAALNEEGEIVDKRQLLGAGLNPGGAKKTSPAAQRARPGNRNAGGRGGNPRESESRAFEEQLLGKRSPSPEDKDREGRAAKSRKMEDELLAMMGSP
ncbi:uncharacterized protein KY384_003102 [Bacidia gigantensis]|uniref:uncharacterized protein n=1 Tax=Bacidia gigantensis TaxID=2732470 RepID=UPI001D0505AE|nr:uncharacterized protein KY384_003102 [Bacidia gigantensis]KAG8531473.1 hypothetical protein KY384_003102 [Bacidia gigantensis]